MFTTIQDASKQKLPSLFTRLKQIYAIEGIRALFAGVVPRHSGYLWVVRFLRRVRAAVRTYRHDDNRRC